MKKIYLIAFLTFNSFVLGNKINWNDTRKVFDSFFENQYTNPISRYYAKIFCSPIFAAFIKLQIDTSCNKAFKDMGPSGPKFNSKSRENCRYYLNALNVLTTSIKEDEHDKNYKDSEKKIKHALAMGKIIQNYKERLKMN